MATGVVGDGPPDGFGLGSRGGGGALGGRIGGTGRRPSSQFGWYAGKVQSSISDALRGNNQTRSAIMSIQVKIWANEAGVVTKAQLVGSTGNPTLDTTLRNEVLSGLRLSEPPPSGMPMPITLRINARKPN
jgi:outer membrane biosynthesis protein TonB